MRKLGVRIAVVAVGLVPSALLLSQATAHADSVPNNTGTNRASTYAPSTVSGDPVWSDPTLIDNGGRRLG